MAANATAEYFRKLGDFLRRDLTSQDPPRRQGALRRIRQTIPGTHEKSDQDLIASIRLGDALNVIAVEQGFSNWREFSVALKEGKMAPHGVIPAEVLEVLKKALRTITPIGQVGGLVPEDADRLTLKEMQIPYGQMRDHFETMRELANVVTALEAGQPILPIMPRVKDIRTAGVLQQRYPVDESQSVSNAGDAEVWIYQGKRYEIITWNSLAVEHDVGSVTVTELEAEEAEEERKGGSDPFRYVVEIEGKENKFIPLFSHDERTGEKVEYRGHAIRALEIAQKQYGRTLLRLWAENDKGEVDQVLFDRAEHKFTLPLELGDWVMVRTAGPFDQKSGEVRSVDAHGFVDVLLADENGKPFLMMFHRAQLDLLEISEGCLECGGGGSKRDPCGACGRGTDPDLNDFVDEEEEDEPLALRIADQQFSEEDWGAIEDADDERLIMWTDRGKEYWVVRDGRLVLEEVK